MLYGGDILSSTRHFYLSERKRKRRRKNSPVIVALFAALVFLLIFLLVNRQFASILESLCEKQLRISVNRAIEDTIEESLPQYKELLSRTIRIRYKEDGTVSSLETDTASLAELRTLLVLRILDRMEKESSLTVRIPVTSLFGINFWKSENTLSIPVHLSRDLHAYFTSEFTEVGINQTLHRVNFHISIGTVLLIPSHPVQLPLGNDYPISETIIVGTVPEAYTRIHRLSDDITETEIDDIYDFGAGAS